MSIRTLIVDDEVLGIQRIQDLLEGEPDVEVVGTCRNGQQALGALRSGKVDLLFLDIRMQGMDGFEVLEELGDTPMPLVIFVTAYDQYALQAFQVHAVDYILKPIQEDRFQEAVARARQLLTKGDQDAAHKRVLELLEAVELRRQRADRFVVRDRDRILFIRTEEVEAIEATGNYAHLLRGKESHMIRCQLHLLEARLPPGRFVRTHRSWLVNLAHVRAVRVLPGGGYALEMRGGTFVPVSKSHRNLVEELVRDPLPGS